MNKIVSSLILALLILSSGASAQTSGAVVTTIPANFTAVDQVKVIVDVSNVGNLVNREPLYIWTWHPNEPAPGNGDWGNSKEERKLVKEGPNKWSWTLKPSDFYATVVNGVLTPMSAGDLTQIKFLVKAKDGNGDKKTDDIILNVAPLVFTPTDFRTFPSTAGQNEIMKVYFDQTLVKDDLNTQRMTPVYADVFLYSNTNQLVGPVITKTVQGLGNKLYSFNVFPRGEFNVPEGTVINRMIVIYKGTILDANGVSSFVNSKPYEKLFDELK